VIRPAIEMLAAIGVAAMSQRRYFMSNL